jgi:glutamine phosphoribosylpyrophosphate amidotransferase
MIGEECGVCACIMKNKEMNMASILHTLLNELQHRGQTSSGIAVFSPEAKKKLKSSIKAGKNSCQRGKDSF